MLKVFISYASEDYTIAKRLYAALQRPGIDPWLDDELRPGGEWNDDIVGEIAACTHFLALISAHSLRDDRFVRREWEQALEQNKPFIPVRLEDCALPDLLKSKQWEDLFPEESGIVRLLRFLNQEKRTAVFEAPSDRDQNGRDRDRRQARRRPVLLPAAQALAFPRRSELRGHDQRSRHRRGERGGGSGRWEARRVNLPTISSDQITLKFAVRASSQMNYSPRAEAWIDDIVIS